MWGGCVTGGVCGSVYVTGGVCGSVYVWECMCVLKIKSGYMMVRDSIICGGVHMRRCSYVEVFI